MNMMEPWFDPNRFAWIPGTAYGCIAAVMGCLVAWFAPRGRARRFIVNAWLALWIAALALLGIGLVALGNRQPWGVWYGLLLPGVIGTLVVGGNWLVIRNAYRQVEQRRLAAKDLL